MNYLIVDDEAHGRVNLRYSMSAYPHWQLVDNGTCADAESARIQLAEKTIDVIFLDIHMPNETGLSLAASICQRKDPPIVIFVSAHHAFALDAFEVHALDYLLKPIDESRLQVAVKRAELLLNQRKRASYQQAMHALLESATLSSNAPRYWHQISIRSIGRIDTYPLDKILWISSAGNYIEYHLSTQTVLQRLTMQQLENHLNPEKFLRCHRRNIVNIKEISGLHIIGDGRYQLQLKNDMLVDVSQRYIDVVRQVCGAN
ncbi:MAG: response regulator transcription factor [Burkholderiales bacterium]|nr:response regulator transcription factor [Burkholderiales bacterium]MBI3731092.1 response regulator transcription factor [Burkholderiales bacterium]